MSDAGAIGTYYTLGQYGAGSAPPSGAASPLYKTLAYSRPLLMWLGATLDSSVAGVISGTVKQNGVALPNASVALYYRKNGQLIARQQATITGTFSFTELPAGVADYYVVALDAPYNALIFDQVAPV